MFLVSFFFFLSFFSPLGVGVGKGQEEDFFFSKKVCISFFRSIHAHLVSTKEENGLINVITFQGLREITK